MLGGAPRVRCHQEPVAVAMLAVKRQPVHRSDCSLVAGSPMDRCLKASDRRRRSNKRPKHTSSLLPAQASEAPPDWTTAGGPRRHPNMGSTLASPLFQLSFSFLTHLVKMLEEICCCSHQPVMPAVSFSHRCRVSCLPSYKRTHSFHTLCLLVHSLVLFLYVGSVIKTHKGSA